MSFIQGPDFFKQVKDALGLPEQVRSVDIHIPCDGAVTVEVDFYPPEGQMENAPGIFKRYKLVDIKETT